MFFLRLSGWMFAVAFFGGVLWAAVELTVQWIVRALSG